MLRHAVCLSAQLMHACSYVAVRAPAEDIEDGGDCSTEFFAPIFDTVPAAAGGAGLVGSIVAIERESDPVAIFGFAILGISSMAALALWGSSAVHGYTHVAECRAIKADVAGRR